MNDEMRDKRVKEAVGEAVVGGGGGNSKLIWIANAEGDVVACGGRKVDPLICPVCECLDRNHVL